MDDLYAVVGNPIGHSKSPRIHQQFAAQTGQSLRYEARLIPLGEFDAGLRDFRDAGGRGMNVTVPFKEDAWAACAQRTQRAEVAGAVNTIWFESQRVCGDNTDGVGLVRDLEVNTGVALAGRRVLLLGAGGASRGVLVPLLDAAPRQLTIANRTVERAVALAKLAADERVHACGFGDLGRDPDLAYDLIINATSAGLDGVAPPVPISALKLGGTCYDMLYGDEPTAFLRWAKVAGADRLIDGLGMLVEQAAESFFRWRGVRPATQPVIKELRSELLAAS